MNLSDYGIDERDVLKYAIFTKHGVGMAQMLIDKLNADNQPGESEESFHAAMLALYESVKPSCIAAGVPDDAIRFMLDVAYRAIEQPSLDTGNKWKLKDMGGIEVRVPKKSA